MPDLSSHEASNRLNMLATHVHHAQGALRMAMNNTFSPETRASSLAILGKILDDMDREIVFPEQNIDDLAALESDAIFIDNFSQAGSD